MEPAYGDVAWSYVAEIVGLPSRITRELWERYARPGLRRSLEWTHADTLRLLRLLSICYRIALVLLLAHTYPSPTLRIAEIPHVTEKVLDRVSMAKLLWTKEKFVGAFDSDFFFTDFFGP